MIEIVPAKAADVERLLKNKPMWRLRAWVARDGDKLLGGGGIYRLPDGTAAAWLVLTEAAKAYPVKILRVVHETLDTLRREGARTVIAEADPEIPNSERFLERLGFTPVLYGGQPLTNDGRAIYRWPK